MLFTLIVVCFGLQVPGLMEKRPSVLKGDHLFVSRSSSLDSDVKNSDEAHHYEYKGYVHKVHASQVCLGFGDEYERHLRYVLSVCFLV